MLSLLSESEFVIICADMNSLVGGADPGLRALDPVSGNVTKTSAETNLPQEVGGLRPSKPGNKDCRAQELLRG